MFSSSRPTTAQHWAQYVGAIYAGDQCSLSELWLRVLENAGEVAHTIRECRFSDLQQTTVLARPLGRLIQFAASAGFDIFDAAWEKFPGLCPYCIDGADDCKPFERDEPSGNDVRVIRQCRCLPLKSRPYSAVKSHLGAFRDRHAARPASLDEWQTLFFEMYSHRHGGRLDTLAFHFIEELGEVATELRRGDAQACAEETADVFSWLMSIINTTQVILGSSLSIDDLMWRAYEVGCPDCGQRPCTGDQI